MKEIDKILDSFYIDNYNQLDELFENYCFHEGRFEFQDQKKMFNNDDVFWNFILDQYLIWGKK